MSMWPTLCRHPLAYIRLIHSWSQEDLGRLIRKAAAARGLRNSTDRNRVSRWESGQVVPDAFSQELLAEVLDIDTEQVAALGWPGWLPAYGLDDLSTDLDHEHTVATGSPAATVEFLDGVTGRAMDRRSFLIASSATVTAAAAAWAGTGAVLAESETSGRRIGMSTAEVFDARLDGLRRLDDRLGSREVHEAARAELRLIITTLRQASYRDTVGQRLYACAAEAARICGWTAYDSSLNAAAEQHYLAALRAASHSSDRAVGATVLAFWSTVRYNGGDPIGALGILNSVTGSAAATIGSARVTALLHARTARAHAKAGNRYGAHQAIGAAFTAYARAKPPAEDVASLYWVTEGELFQVAASTALETGEYRQALIYFANAEAAADPYDTDREPRGAAIYAARRAETYLALGDLDAAVALAREAVDRLGGAASARGDGTIRALRAKLAAHQDVAEVRGFLDDTA